MTAEFRAWADVFLANATQLDQPVLGAQWYRMGVPADEAAAWANLGFYPGEAAPHIEAGITAQTYREMEDYATQQAGGQEALAAMRLAELLGTGALLGPDDVVIVQDPTNPGVEIIALREDDR